MRLIDRHDRIPYAEFVKRNMDIIRAAILDEYQRRKKADSDFNPYRLWKLVNEVAVATFGMKKPLKPGKAAPDYVSRSTIYAFIDGKDVSLTTENASHILRALNIPIPAEK